MNSAFETDRLAALIQARHQVLRQLCELAERQTALIDQGDMTHLLSVLAAKQTLLVQLQKAEHELDPFRDQDPRQRHWRDADQRQKCVELAEQCEQFLRRIVDCEKHSESALVQRRDEAARRLQGAHSASEARFAYTEQPETHNHGTLDLTSD